MKFERINKGVSQAEIARLAGMHPTTVSLIENGRLRPYPGHIKKLVSVFEWKGDPEELFEEVEA